VDAGIARMVVGYQQDRRRPDRGIAVTHATQFTRRGMPPDQPTPVPQRMLRHRITLTNAFQYSMPANSVTTLVLLP
jgi:hypothetical protein